jgi:hypothetical protein
MREPHGAKRVTTDTGGEFIFAGASTLTSQGFRHRPNHESCIFLNSPPVSRHPLQQCGMMPARGYNLFE